MCITHSRFLEPIFRDKMYWILENFFSELMNTMWYITKTSIKTTIISLNIQGKMSIWVDTDKEILGWITFFNRKIGKK